MNKVREFKRLRGLRVLGLAVCAAVGLMMPTLATAQDGPQFPNWGPGVPPPDQEGPDVAAPSMAPGGAYGYGAPGPSGVTVPYGGCHHDLRGSWWNSGRLTSGGSSSYSAWVYVRQYRSWIHAQQDDGTAYYGQCVGSRLQFDMYSGYQYLGRQSGTVSSGYWRTPIPLYEEWTPLYAPGAPAPVGRWGIQASFTWTTWYGSGSETWYRTSYGMPWVVEPWPPVEPRWVPTPRSSPTPTVMPPSPTSTPTLPTPIATPAGLPVRIESLFPARGPAGLEVLVNGGGFTAEDNLVTFGASSGLRRADGMPANLASRAGSTDGRTLRFTVPWSSPSGLLCDEGGTCVNITATLLQPGSYDVTVTNSIGTSNSVPFEITSNSGTPAR